MYLYPFFLILYLLIHILFLLSSYSSSSCSSSSYFGNCLRNLVLVNPKKKYDYTMVNTICQLQLLKVTQKKIFFIIYFYHKIFYMCTTNLMNLHFHQKQEPTLKLGLKKNYFQYITILLNLVEQNLNKPIHDIWHKILK